MSLRKTRQTDGQEQIYMARPKMVRADKGLPYLHGEEFSRAYNELEDVLERLHGLSEGRLVFRVLVSVVHVLLQDRHQLPANTLLHYIVT